MENKLSAVKWLQAQIVAHAGVVRMQMIEKAIEIEKEQMEASYSEGLKRMSYIRSLVDGLMVPDENPVPDDFETFYKNNYGQP